MAVNIYHVHMNVNIYICMVYIENLCVRNERFAKAKSLRPTLVFLALC